MHSERQSPALSHPHLACCLCTHSCSQRPIDMRMQTSFQPTPICSGLACDVLQGVILTNPLRLSCDGFSQNECCHLALINYMYASEQLGCKAVGRGRPLLTRHAHLRNLCFLFGCIHALNNSASLSLLCWNNLFFGFGLDLMHSFHLFVGPGGFKKCCSFLKDCYILV